VVNQATRQRYQSARPNTRALLPELFPQAPPRPDATPGRVAVRAVLSVIALVTGAVALLLRVAGPSPLTTIWAEDLTVYLVQALASPWHLFASYAGYLQLLPRFIGQFAALLPLRDAAAVFAISGALTASAVAVFVFHASAGHVRSAGLRVLLAAAVLLLPVAPLEIVDSGVNTPWYLLFALFWAALWRPRTRTGMAGAAFVGFIAMASNPLALALAPLLAVRVVALRRVREHTVTAGWAAGLLLQVPVMLTAPNSRVNKTARPGQVLAFLVHDVVLPVFGWHVDWWLQSAVGRRGAMLLVAVVLLAVLSAIIVIASARIRLFTAAALVSGLLLATVAATLSPWVTTLPIHYHVEPGSRYTTLPIFLIEATAIAAVDWAVRRAGNHVPGGLTPRPRAAAAAVAALVLVLSVGWITDFRYPDGRAGAPLWSQVSGAWRATCRHSPGPDPAIRVPSGEESHVVIQCSALRG
jgi:hypothetical protein